MAQDKIRPFNKERGINDVYDFNEYATEMWETFLLSMKEDKRFVRPATKNDEVGPEIELIYTDRGIRLADDMRDRLMEVGSRHFPDGDIEIESFYYYED